MSDYSEDQKKEEPRKSELQKSDSIKNAKSDVSLKQAVAAMKAQAVKLQLSTTSRATSQMSIATQRKEEQPALISAEQLQEISSKQEKIGKDQEKLVKAVREELSERIHELEESIQGNLK